MVIKLTDIEKNEVRKEFIRVHTYFELWQFDEECALLQKKIKEIDRKIPGTQQLQKSIKRRTLNWGIYRGVIVSVLAYNNLKKKGFHVKGNFPNERIVSVFFAHHWCMR